MTLALALVLPVALAIATTDGPHDIVTLRAFSLACLALTLARLGLQLDHRSVRATAFVIALILLYLTLTPISRSWSPWVPPALIVIGAAVAVLSLYDGKSRITDLPLYPFALGWPVLVLPEAEPSFSSEFAFHAFAEAITSGFVWIASLYTPGRDLCRPGPGQISQDLDLERTDSPRVKG